MESMKNHISKKVRSAMKEQKITWDALAEKTGSSKRIIAAVLKPGNYKIDSLVKICDALKINILKD